MTEAHAVRRYADDVGTSRAITPPAAIEPDDQLIADVFARNCESRRILENVAGKWSILALAALHDGSFRFNALRRRVDGVSEKMLAQTLQALERDGFIDRDVQATIPPRVEYSLTSLGADVATRIVALIELLEDSVDDVADAQQRYDETRRHIVSPT